MAGRQKTPLELGAELLALAGASGDDDACTAAVSQFLEEENLVATGERISSRQRHIVNCRATDAAGLAPLHAAALNGRVGAISALLAVGAHANVESIRDRLTPAHCAAKNGHRDALHALFFEGGANLRLFDANGDDVRTVAKKSSGAAEGDKLALGLVDFIDELNEQTLSSDAPPRTGVWSQAELLSSSEDEEEEEEEEEAGGSLFGSGRGGLLSQIRRGTSLKGTQSAPTKSARFRG
jgi:Ankyrin repeats (3 copies)